MDVDDAFRIHRWIPHQLVLSEPRLDDLIWDECIREAHEQGKMPVGPVMIRQATPEEREEQLEKEHPFKRTEVHLAGEVLYIAEVMLGLSLD